MFHVSLIFVFRYADAKRLGEQVNTSRQKISTLLYHQHPAFAVDYFNLFIFSMIADSIKTQIEQHRVRRSMQGILNLLVCLFCLFYSGNCT